MKQAKSGSFQPPLLNPAQEQYKDGKLGDRNDLVSSSGKSYKDDATALSNSQSQQPLTSIEEEFSGLKGKATAGFPMQQEDDNLLELGLVKNPICRRFFTLFRFIGVVIAMSALVADYTYAFK